MKIHNLTAWCMVLVMTVILMGCSKEGTGVPNATSHDYADIALEFTQALANRDYSKAYAMTTKEYQNKTTLQSMKNAFEEIVPPDWGVMGPIEIGETMVDWPDKKPSDLGWAYVSIGGDIYSEAVTTIITLEGETAKIREIEYGRP